MNRARIDWDTLRAKGEQGTLTAPEAEALIVLARRAMGGAWCPYCGAWLSTTPLESYGHADGCPIAVLLTAPIREEDNNG